MDLPKDLKYSLGQCDPLKSMDLPPSNVFDLPPLNLPDEAAKEEKDIEHYCRCNEPKDIHILDLKKIQHPVGVTAEELLHDLIQNRWKLTDKFMYIIRFREVTRNEGSLFYFFEAVFSQPSAAYPIPQVTCSVFFRVEVKLTEPPNKARPPMLYWRVEGHHCEYDARLVNLTEHPILAMLIMKIKVFKRIESYRIF